MPAKYDKLGLSFQFPDNWTLDEEDAVAGQESVTVYSPGGGFWCVALHPQSAEPARLAKAVVEAMRQEYEGLEAEEAHETLVGHELVGYDLSFFYLDLTSTARIRSLRAGQTTYTFFCQADDREFEAVGRVFEAITASLLMGLSQ